MLMKKENEFKKYREALSDTEANILQDFFDSVDSHIALSRDEKALMLRDFENALLYYVSQGVSLDDALERLSIVNLGGFYARPPILWYPLDDSAKIYPLSTKHGQMAIFRLSVYLKENIIPELLQMALTFTIKRFPSFATTIKKGFFWHYLDAAKRRYLVEQETEMPCKPLPISKSGSQSFRVIYCNNRISVDYFHVLTDGTGGVTFLKTLTAEYLRLLGIKAEQTKSILNINDAPKSSEIANEFPRAEKTKKVSGFIDKPAIQYSGKLAKRRPCCVLHFKMDAEKLKSTAKAYNTTVTAYVLALMFIASKYAVDETEGDISIQVPVNMRKFYPSETLRNFSMYCGIRFPLCDINDIPSMLEKIAQQLSQKASKEAMSEMMNAAEKMVNALRYIPLAVKTPVVRIVYGFLGDRIFSNILTNLGVVKMPEELSKHILSMDFVLGAAIMNRASCAMVTYENTTTLSITKMTVDPSFEERLYDLLNEAGIPVAVEGSALYEN